MKFQDSKRSANFHARNYKRGAAILLTLFIVALLAAFCTDASAGACAIGAPFFLGSLMGDRIFLDKDDGPSGGGGTMTEEQFRTAVLDQTKAASDDVKALRSQMKTFEPKFEDLDKQTKTTIEELTTVKNNFKGLSADVQEATLLFRKLQLQLGNARKDAFSSPIERILADETKKARINALARLLSTKGGDKVQSAGLAILKALGEDTSPGSTIIDDDLALDIYDTLQRFGKYQTMSVRKLGTKQTKLPIKTVRPVCNVILTEGGTAADDANKAGATVTLEVEMLATLLNVSLQLLEDAEIDVAADVLDDFSEATAFRLDFLTFRADGTADATNGGMTGAFNFGTAAVAGTGDTSVEVLEFEDVVACLLAVDPGVLDRMTKWWMHPQILVRMLSIKDSNGRPIFLTAMEAPAPGSIGSILGSPVVPVQAAPNANTVNSKVALFGDPNAFVVGVRKDFEFDSSDHARWNTIERSFRGIARGGTKGRRAQGLSVLTLAAS